MSVERDLPIRIARNMRVVQDIAEEGCAVDMREIRRKVQIETGRTMGDIGASLEGSAIGLGVGQRDLRAFRCST